jgi:hypothetical protein
MFFWRIDLEIKLLKKNFFYNFKIKIILKKLNNLLKKNFFYILNNFYSFL